MVSTIDNLSKLSDSQLRDLLSNYHVKTHSGKTYTEPITPSKASLLIETWLEPEKPISTDNELEFIRNGKPFEISMVNFKKLFNEVFEDKIPISSMAISDFGKYPMRRAFGKDPWKLLKEYINSNNRDKYFQSVTGLDPNTFLNNTERVFYLTRGYGRPNHYISMKDLSFRRFYMNAVPTSLIALMDILGICSLKQDPNVVRENLSRVDLKNIDKFHTNAVAKISQCLGKGKICARNGENSENVQVDVSKCSGLTCESVKLFGYGESVGCDSYKTECYKSFLRSIGMLDRVSFDPTTETFKSNISQLSLYKQVIPSLKYNFNDIKNQSRLYIQSYIAKLSDNEILKITVPSGIDFSDYIDLEEQSSRLRSNLTMKALTFLTEKKYFLNVENGVRYVVYGRPVDDDFMKVTEQDFVESIKSKGALIDPSYNVISLYSAKEMNRYIKDPELSMVIRKTEMHVRKTQSILKQIDTKKKLSFKQDLLNLPRHFTIEELNEELLGYGSWARDLILWKENNIGFHPVSISIGKYIKDISPQYKDIIEDTVKYYIQTL